MDERQKNLSIVNYGRSDIPDDRLEQLSLRSPNLEFKATHNAIYQRLPQKTAHPTEQARQHTSCTAVVFGTDQADNSAMLG